MTAQVYDGRKLPLAGQSTPCLEGVVQHNAEEQAEANPVVVEKGLEAGVPLAVADQVLLVDEQGGGGHDTEKVPVTQFCPLTDEAENQHREHLQGGGDGAVGLAKQDGGGFNADLEIVVP